MTNWNNQPGRATIGYCKCGCGGILVEKPHHKYYGKPDYIHGHNGQGTKRTAETREKMRQAQLGKKHSAETKAKLSKMWKGRKRPKETYEKISRAKKGRIPSNIKLLSTREVINKRRKTLAKTMAKKIKNGLPIGLKTCRGGKRKDLGNVFFRSTWEANYARLLNLQGVRWEFEKHSFEFHSIRRGTRFYLPDFYLPDEDVWVEVKGYMRNEGRTRLKRFKKYYPDEFKKLKVVIWNPYAVRAKDQRKVVRFLLYTLQMPPENLISYSELNKKYKSIIPHWE